MPSWVAAITLSGFWIAFWTAASETFPWATSSAMRVWRTLTNENSAATKKPLANTNSMTMASFKRSRERVLSIVALCNHCRSVANHAESFAGHIAGSSMFHDLHRICAEVFGRPQHGGQRAAPAGESLTLFFYPQHAQGIERLHLAQHFRIQQVGGSLCVKMRQVGAGHQGRGPFYQDFGQRIAQGGAHPGGLVAHHHGYQAEFGRQGTLQKGQFDFQRMFWIVAD